MAHSHPADWPDYEVVPNCVECGKPAITLEGDDICDACYFAQEEADLKAERRAKAGR